MHRQSNLAILEAYRPRCLREVLSATCPTSIPPSRLISETHKIPEGSLTAPQPYSLTDTCNMRRNSTSLNLLCVRTYWMRKVRPHQCLRSLSKTEITAVDSTRQRARGEATPSLTAYRAPPESQTQVRAECCVPYSLFPRRRAVVYQLGKTPRASPPICMDTAIST